MLQLPKYFEPTSIRSQIACDVVVYGATPGGIAAAVQAARLGSKVCLVEMGPDVGGMMTGGLSSADHGEVAAISGFAKEVYAAIGKQYGSVLSLAYEPHVARAALLALIKASGVQVLLNQPIRSAQMDGAVVSSITTVGGSEFHASMFIDASYDGDLLAACDIPTTIGREASSTFHESLAGIRRSTGANAFSEDVDPYQTSGDAGSGLLPLIQPEGLGAIGGADSALPAYSFRLCLSQASSRLPFREPADYDADRYELLNRYIATGVDDSLDFLSALPNGKHDLNNGGAISTDYIGGNVGWADATYEQRAAIYSDHQSYLLGLLWFMQSDPSVPQAMRSHTASLGFASGEFSTSGGLPWQLYIRESRRLVGEYVMTQADIMRQTTALDPIGVGTYQVDSHTCRRLALNGAATNEGDILEPIPGPYAIPKAALTPLPDHATNVLSAVCISSSHVAYSSLRIEATYMATGQAAGVIAHTALGQKSSVQEVDYSKVKATLQAADVYVAPAA